MNAPVPGLPARKAAMQMLDAILRRGETMEQVLPWATRPLTNPSDKGLAHNIAALVLRWMVVLDSFIDAATAQKLAEDAKARSVLRIALAQALLLGTPHHAAIATALPLVSGGPRRLVHGVFSAVLRKIKAGELVLPEAPPLPEETEARWHAHWGEAMVQAARRAWAVQPPLDLTYADADKSSAAAGVLGGESFLPNHLRLMGQPSVTELPGFEAGEFWVQDLSASLPARLLGAGEGRSVLDLCTAPGGKAMQLASAGWRVTAVDSSAKRMERMQGNCARTGVQLETVVANVLQWAPEAPVDAILLDAPCSATGIFRRHPDVLHIVGPRQIVEQSTIQTAMLERVSDWLKPGGRLVYATCSLEPEEGEQQIAAFLAKHPDFAVSPIDATALPDGVSVNADGYLRILPGMLPEKGGLDGFFIALLEKSHSM